MYALLKQTDATIGRISETIRRKGMWDDSLVVLASDNGGHKGGTNYPLRGQKGTNFEEPTPTPNPDPDPRPSPRPSPSPDPSPNPNQDPTMSTCS